MCRANGVSVGQVGNGARQAQGLRDGGGGEVELAGRGPQQAVAGGLDGGRVARIPVCYASVRQIASRIPGAKGGDEATHDHAIRRDDHDPHA